MSVSDRCRGTEGRTTPTVGCASNSWCPAACGLTEQIRVAPPTSGVKFSLLATSGHPAGEGSAAHPEGRDRSATAPVVRVLTWCLPSAYCVQIPRGPDHAVRVGGDPADDNDELHPARGRKHPENCSKSVTGTPGRPASRSADAARRRSTSFRRRCSGVSFSASRSGVRDRRRFLYRSTTSSIDERAV